MNSELLTKLQESELSILIDIDSYCKKYNINYSLYAGTMLGAVRHKGFIPWDDDVDICMTRSEFTKFCRIIKKHPMQGYYFQYFENDHNCMMNHGKIRKNGTILLSEGEDETIGHHGVWVDIFPLDKISREKKKAFKTIVAGKIIVFLTRANLKISTSDTKKKIINRVIRLVPDTIRQRILKYCAGKLRKYDRTIVSNYDWTSMSALYSMKYRYPNSILRKYGTLTLNGKKFMSFDNAGGMLKIIYGDYMKLPPRSERVCRHKPKKIQL